MFSEIVPSKIKIMFPTYFYDLDNRTVSMTGRGWDRSEGCGGQRNINICGGGGQKER